MNPTAAKFLDAMTLPQKIGQMLVYGFCGAYPHRDILDVIDKYNVAGFRVTPYARRFIRYLPADHPGVDRVIRPREPHERSYGAHAKPQYLSAVQYAEVLNTLRRRSMETGAGVPLYFALDFEGGGSADFLPPGMHTVPHPAGQGATGDPDLVRQLGYLVGSQLKAAGIDWVHSPEVDVNTDPMNPEVSTRSYAPDPQLVSQMGLQTLLGYREARLVGTGKHFPGRGQSAQDAHYDVPIINESAQRMREVHLAPYRTLIEHGLPAIMLAHSVYPSLDPSNEVSTLSRPIVTDLLRQEMGFEGVIMTDSFTMGGLVARYEVAEAAVRTIEAGVDLILLKDENALRGEVYEALLEAVRSGRISEQQVHDSAGRVLQVKAEYGLLEGEMGIVDTDELTERLASDEWRNIARDGARRSVCWVRRAGEAPVPLPDGARVLVVEENHGNFSRHNDQRSHIGMLYEQLLARGVDADYFDFDKHNLDEHLPTLRDLAAEAHVVVFTGYYNRGNDPHKDNYRKLQDLGKPTVFVANNPYPVLVDPDMPNVLMIAQPTRFAMEMAADVLTGQATPTAKLPYDPTQNY